MIALAVFTTLIPAPTSNWSFRNHVLPVLTKAGCNGGACHGALAGKGGLKLSLRGFDPVSDYNVFTLQSFGRRVVKGHPELSLMLQKPTMMIGHGGGERIKKGSLDYQIVAGWIRSGAIGPNQADPQLVGVTATPATSTHKAGDSQQITVTARYSDGHTEDVTRWVKFGSSDAMVATVDDLGKVKCMGSGEAAITVWFNSKVTFARIVSPYSGKALSAVTIDQLERIVGSTDRLRPRTNEQQRAFDTYKSESMKIDSLIDQKLISL